MIYYSIDEIINIDEKLDDNSSNNFIAFHNSNEEDIVDYNIEHQKSTETQTSPKFSRESRRQLKRQLKSQRSGRKSKTNESNHSYNDNIAMTETTVAVTQNLNGNDSANEIVPNHTDEHIEEEHIIENSINNQKTENVEPEPEVNEIRENESDSKSQQEQNKFDPTSELKISPSPSVEPEAVKKESPINDATDKTSLNNLLITEQEVKGDTKNSPKATSLTPKSEKKVKPKVKKNTETRTSKTKTTPSPSLGNKTPKVKITPSPSINARTPKTKAAPTPKINNKVDKNEFEEVRKSINSPAIVQYTNLIDGVNIPDRNFKLTWVYGYKGDVKQSNLIMLPTGELVYYTAAIAVLWHLNSNTQRHYTGHTHDIQCLDVHNTENVIATVQNSDSGGRGPSNAQVNVWSPETLRTLAILSTNELGKTVAGIAFSHKGFLIVACVQKRLKLILWNWRKQEIMLKATQSLRKEEVVLGIACHPSNLLCATYGQKHLRLWEFQRNRFGNKSIVSADSKIKFDLGCIHFLPDDGLVSGDFDGNLTIWSPLHDSSDKLQFIFRHIKGHNNRIKALLLLSEDKLISGDANCTLKIWSIKNLEIKSTNEFNLSGENGELCSLASSKYERIIEKETQVFIGTSFNMIFRVRPFKSSSSLLFEGHAGGLRSIATHPGRTTIYSLSLDHKLCKWEFKLLVWKCIMEEQCASIAVHPSARIIALGTASGAIVIVNSEDGEKTSELHISEEPIGCLQFSMQGDLLAAGTQDGIIYILPVTENSFSYEKVSALKGPSPILTLQWSTDGQYILTSVNESNFQELILWDLPNFRYMRGCSSIIRKIEWYDATCSGGDDVRGIWDNSNVHDINYISCHCSFDHKYLASGDDKGVIRLFSYPCFDPDSGYYKAYQGSTGVVDVRFLPDNEHFVTANFEGSIFLWELFIPEANEQEDE